MLKDLIKKYNLKGLLFCLKSGIYKIQRCPVCGHLYLGKDDICYNCGYEPAFHGSQGEDFEKFKREYLNENHK